MRRLVRTSWGLTSGHPPDLGTELNTFETNPPLGHIEQKLLLVSAGFAGFAIPCSTAAQNISTLFLLLCLVGMAGLRAQLVVALRIPLVRAALGFYALLVLGCLWAEVDWSNRLEMLRRMRAYLLTPVFVACLIPRPSRMSLLAGFVIGVVLSVLVSMFIAATGLIALKAVPGNYPSFRTHTEHNLFIAWVAAGLLCRLLWGEIEDRRWRLAAILVIALLLFDDFFLVRGRTAQALMLLMIPLILFQRWGLRSVLPQALILATLVPILFWVSPVIQSGSRAIVSDMRELSKGQGQETSLGLRMEFAQNTLKIIESAAVFGHGTGSFSSNYERLTGFTKATDGQRASHNPHNDFLWLWSEVGLLGPLALLVLVLAFVYSIRRLSRAQAVTIQAISLSMIVGTLGNSFFTDKVSGVGFIVVASALVAGPWCHNGTAKQA